MVAKADFSRAAMHLSTLPADREVAAAALHEAMQLTDQRPADHDTAVALLREAVKLGITHIDTADFYGYGLYLTNQILKEGP